MFHLEKIRKLPVYPVANCIYDTNITGLRAESKDKVYLVIKPDFSCERSIHIVSF